MFKRLILAILLAQAPLLARDVAPLAAPEPDPNEPALTIDTWKPKAPLRREAPPPEPEAAAPAKSASPATEKPTPAKEDTKAPPSEKQAPAVPPTPRIAMNEMSGTLTSIDSETGAIRLSVAGGFNVQFETDKATQFLSKGQKLPLTALATGEKITVRYVGREMTAREIEKTGP
jgi:hypothetical protein